MPKANLLVYTLFSLSMSGLISCAPDKKLVPDDFNPPDIQLVKKDLSPFREANVSEEIFVTDSFQVRDRGSKTPVSSLSKIGLSHYAVTTVCENPGFEPIQRQTHTSQKTEVSVLDLIPLEILSPGAQRKLSNLNGIICSFEFRFFNSNGSSRRTKSANYKINLNRLDLTPLMINIDGQFIEPNTNKFFKIDKLKTLTVERISITEAVLSCDRSFSLVHGSTQMDQLGRNLEKNISFHRFSNSPSPELGIDSFNVAPHSESCRVYVRLDDNSVRASNNFRLKRSDNGIDVGFSVAVAKSSSDRVTMQKILLFENKLYNNTASPLTYRLIPNVGSGGFQFIGRYDGNPFSPYEWVQNARLRAWPDRAFDATQIEIQDHKNAVFWTLGEHLFVTLNPKGFFHYFLTTQVDLRCGKFEEIIGYDFDLNFYGKTTIEVAVTPVLPGFESQFELSHGIIPQFTEAVRNDGRNRFGWFAWLPDAAGPNQAYGNAVKPGTNESPGLPGCW